MAHQEIKSGKPYIRWETVGQAVTGTLHKIELSRGSSDQKMIHLIDSDGAPFMVSAPLLLAEVIEDHFDALQDKVITITFTGQDAPVGKKSGLMRFTVGWDDGKK